jgi:signal transduction histidine kinase
VRAPVDGAHESLSDGILMTATTSKATTRNLRLVVGLAIAAALPFAPWVTRGEGVTLSVAAATYVVGSWLLERIGVRRPRFPARALIPLLGLVVITVVMIAIPRTLEVGLVLFVLGVAFSTYVVGRTLGLWLAAGAVPAAIVADYLAPDADRVDGATLVAFAVAVPLLAIVVDRLTAERRRTTAALAQLHDALGAIEAQPDLAATLDSIAASIAQTVRPTVAVVMQRSGESFSVAARATVPSSLTAEEVEWFTRVELDLGRDSPLGRMLERTSLVFVDLDHDPRFTGWTTPWARTLRGLGCQLLVLAPLRLSGDVIGVVAAAFAERGRPEKHDLAFLEAFAERASRVVVRAAAYERERVAALKLAQAADEKSEFLGLVSHELRTPLTAVKGFVDTVLQHWERLPDDRRRELLDRASTNADELNRLVGQLLEFSRLDATAVSVSPRPTAVSDVIDGVLDDLGPALAEHRVDVDVDSAGVLADPRAFGQVMTSLLTNAAKFSPAGSPIAVRAHAGTTDVVVSVADHGSGIPLDEQDRIFDRFFQSPSNVLTRRGTGIGLSIAKRLVEMQGGGIRVESLPGVGSTFFVTMPAASLPSAEPAREEVTT